MRLVLLGPPGAGKGTQGVVLSKKYSIPHISTGDMLREAVKSGNTTGKKAKEYMDKGELVPDKVVNAIIVERLGQGDAKDGFILDGFPRTVPQAEMLDESLVALGIGLDLVLYFETSKNVAIMRLTGRRICPRCGANYHVKNIPPKKDGICDHCGEGLVQRKDDTEETVRRRLVVYEEQTKSLVDYYTRRGGLRRISGDMDVDEVFRILSGMFRDEKLV